MNSLSIFQCLILGAPIRFRFVVNDSAQLESTELYEAWAGGFYEVHM